MSTQELIPLGPQETFTFDCRPGLACFNLCCRGLNQALTPYDTLRLRAYLQCSSDQFRQAYVDIYPGPSTGLPVASLRFAGQADQRCPFVRDTGCSVYAARPSSCRMYPLARALRRSRSDGRLDEHYALLHEAHCRGFEQDRTWTVRQWIEDQALADYLRINDALMELIALKNRLRPGPLPPDQWHWASMAFYDLDSLKQKALSAELKTACRAALPDLPPASGDDEQWLSWSLQWIRRVMFGRHA